jgi:non-heme chloroperoxidase
MGFITARDGTDLYYKDWGRGQPVVFNHAYALNGDTFEDQMFFLTSRGYRCIAHDRRGHGRSGQPWLGYDIDTFATDLADIMDQLDLKHVVLVGHSTGSAVVARYIGQHGTKRVDKVVLIGVVTPLVAKTESNTEGIPIEAFNGYREAVLADRFDFFRNLNGLYLGANRPGAQISQGLLDATFLQETMSCVPAAHDSIKAYSETDTTDDLKQIDVPTLILHGDDDQIAPVRNAYRSAKLIKRASLKIYAGGAHAIPTTMKRRVSEDILDFVTDVAIGPTTNKTLAHV